MSARTRDRRRPGPPRRQGAAPATLSWRGRAKNALQAGRHGRAQNALLVGRHGNSQKGYNVGQLSCNCY